MISYTREASIVLNSHDPLNAGNLLNRKDSAHSLTEVARSTTKLQIYYLILGLFWKGGDLFILHVSLNICS